MLVLFCYFCTYRVRNLRLLFQYTNCSTREQNSFFFRITSYSITTKLKLRSLFHSSLSLPIGFDFFPIEVKLCTLSSVFCLLFYIPWPNNYTSHSGFFTGTCWLWLTNNRYLKITLSAMLLPNNIITYTFGYVHTQIHPTVSNSSLN